MNFMVLIIFEYVFAFFAYLYFSDYFKYYCDEFATCIIAMVDYTFKVLTISFPFKVKDERRSRSMANLLGKNRLGLLR